MAFVVYHRDQICFFYAFRISNEHIVAIKYVFFYALRIINEHRDILDRFAVDSKYRIKTINVHAMWQSHNRYTTCNQQHHRKT